LQGGLFHTPKATLSELNEIVRHDYYVKPPIPYPQNIKGATPAGNLLGCLYLGYFEAFFNIIFYK
jgi:hypothetical protein